MQRKMDFCVRKFDAASVKNFHAIAEMTFVKDSMLPGGGAQLPFSRGRQGARTDELYAGQKPRATADFLVCRDPRWRLMKKTLKMNSRNTRTDTFRART